VGQIKRKETYGRRIDPDWYYCPPRVVRKRISQEFANGLGDPFFGLMATHPPLADRIRALDPRSCSACAAMAFAATVPAIPHRDLCARAERSTDRSIRAHAAEDFNSPSGTYFVPARGTITQYYSLRPMVADCGVLLSAMAYAGHKSDTEAKAAFEQGAQSLSYAAQTGIPFLPEAQCDLGRVDAALARLSQAVPQIKKNVLNACVLTIAADEIIHEREAELVRAIADALDCPIPPLVQPQG
jgi:hypothetical protein